MSVFYIVEVYPGFSKVLDGVMPLMLFTAAVEAQKTAFKEQDELKRKKWKVPRASSRW